MSEKLPWDEPSAKGTIGNKPDREWIEQCLAAYEEAFTSLTGTPFHTEFFAFLRTHTLQTQRDAFPGGELWTSRFDYELMERWVSVRCWQATWDDTIELELSSLAIWNKNNPTTGGLQGWFPVARRRWIGMTTRSPVGYFRASLELILDDAKSYTPADLHPLPAGHPDRPPARPWPGWTISHPNARDSGGDVLNP